jgi:hypothetical protein
MPSMLLYLPISFVFALEREFALARVNFSDQLKIVLAGELTSFLFLHICSLTLLRNRKIKQQSLILCIFVWAITGVIRGFYAEFYATSILDLDSHAALRILVSVLFTTLGLGFAAYSFGSIYELETKKAALQSLNGFINSENSNLNTEQIAMKEEAIITLQQTLIPKVIQLQRLTAGLKKYELSQPLALALFSLEEQAHRLAYQMRVNLDNLESIPNPRSGIVSRIFSSTQTTLKPWPNLLSVKLSFFFLSIGGVVVQFGRNTTVGALSSLLGSIFSVIILFSIHRFSERVTFSKKSKIFACAYIAIFVVQYFYSSQLVPRIFELSQPFNPWYSATKVTFAVYLASLFLSFLKEDAILLQSMSKESSNSREILDLKNSKNEKLEAVNISTNQGELQGQLSGVIMALNLLTKDEDTFLSSKDPSGIINNANTLLSNAIEEIQNLSIRELLN